MTYSENHYYLTWGGAFGNVEYWQTGQRFLPKAGNPNNSTDTLLGTLDDISMTDILGDINAVLTSSSPQFHQNTSITWAKLAVIGKDGKYAGDPKLQEQAPVKGIGGSADGMPWVQLALCVSLWSGQNFGKANHGRQYWPMPAGVFANNVDGQIKPIETCRNLGISVRQMLGDVNGEISTVLVDTAPAIMSKIGAGTSKVVERVGVGGVLDTIRSRREALDDEVKEWQDRGSAW